MAIILHTESSMGWGGQEIRVMQESLGMIKRGHRAMIAAPAQSSIYKRAAEAGIDVLPAHFSKRNPATAFKMLSILKKEKPDIINTHSSSDSWISTIAARMSGAGHKIIRTKHLSAPISSSYLSRLIYETLPDAVITTGEEIRRRMIEDNGFDAAKIFSVPTGIDLERFNTDNISPAFPTNGFSIGMIGVLRSWKGHAFFLEAVPKILEHIKDAVFYIAGDGPQFSYIKEAVETLRLGSRVHMLGYREDVPEILASLDVIVHPSYANEGVPQSVLQALAMSKAVVASDAGAIKEVIINGETGFLIEPRNSDKIAEKVVELYKKPELRNKFGGEGRRLVTENYSLENMLDKIELIYKKLLNNA